MKLRLNSNIRPRRKMLERKRDFGEQMLDDKDTQLSVKADCDCSDHELCNGIGFNLEPHR